MALFLLHVFQENYLLSSVSQSADTLPLLLMVSWKDIFVSLRTFVLEYSSFLKETQNPNQNTLPKITQKHNENACAWSIGISISCSQTILRSILSISALSSHLAEIMWSRNDSLGFQPESLHVDQDQGYSSCYLLCLQTQQQVAFQYLCMLGL